MGHVQTPVVFVFAEYHLELLPVCIAAVYGLCISLQIRLEDHHPASHHHLVIVLVLRTGRMNPSAACQRRSSPPHEPCPFPLFICFLLQYATRRSMLRSTPCHSSMSFARLSLNRCVLKGDRKWRYGCISSRCDILLGGNLLSATIIHLVMLLCSMKAG